MDIESIKSFLDIGILKWIIALIGAIGSFYIIDWGKLKLEKQKAINQKEQSLLNAYLDATETSNPDLWLRKLRLIKTFSKDTTIIEWALDEEKEIEEKSALIQLYKETMQVTSVLANKNTYNTKDWVEASKRYYQLYWAELPYYGESKSVEKAMVKFKQKLDDIEKSSGIEKWEAMNIELIVLSTTLKEEREKLKNA